MDVICEDLIKASETEIVSSIGNDSEYRIGDITPREYLKYANDEIRGSKDAVRNKINTVNHLKKAIESQIDTFFVSIGLKHILKKNLGLVAKSEFLVDIDLISSYSLRKINEIRNKVEHDYEVPKIEDIELYLEVITMSVKTIDSNIRKFLRNETMNIDCTINGHKKRISIENTFEKNKGIVLTDVREDREINFCWKRKSDYESYVKYFKLYNNTCDFYDNIYSQEQYQNELKAIFKW